MSFKDRIKYIRGELTQKEFAKKLGVSLGAVQHWEGDNKIPNGETLRHIHDILRIDINWLLTGEGSPAIDKKEDDNIVPMDPAVGLVTEVENELGIKLNEKQRQAVVAVLRRELDRRINEQKTEIANLISSFTKGD